MPCMNFSDERESSERTTFSLTKWTSMPSSSIVTQSLMLRYRRSVFSTKRIRHDEDFSRRNATISPKRRAAGALGGLDVLELLDDVNTLTLRVFVEQLSLRRDRESLFLLFGRNADVHDRSTAR